MISRGKLLRKIDDRGMTLQDVARAATMSYTTVWNLANGTAGDVRISTVRRICQVLECKPEDILENQV